MNDSTRHQEVPAATAMHAWTFFRQWLKNPRAMASLSPSSRRLAHEMIAQLPSQSRRVIELGAGTGVFTRALIEHGIEPRNLLVVELNNELYKLLKRRFPGTHVVNGNACDLAGIVATAGFGEPGGVDAVVSGLGFLAMPRPVQRRILEEVFALLAPGSPLIQFTYAPTNPLPRDLLNELGLGVRRAGVTWMNVPPAIVYVYTRNRSKSIHAVRVGDAG